MKNILCIGIWLLAALMIPVAHSQEIQTMNTDAQAVATAQALIDRHFEIWNNRNSEARLQGFAATYTEDFSVADYAGMASTFPAVNQLIERVLTQHPGFSFSPEPVAWNHGMGRVRWGFGPGDKPDQVRGEDIFTVRDGKLASMHVFLDNQ